MTTYSHSRISQFENCPLAFKFHYIDGIKSDVEGVEAFMGSRVHDTLEHLYKGVKVTNVYSKEELLEYFEADWEKNWHDGITIVRRENKPENYFELGKKCISMYYDRHHPFDRMKTVATEMRVNLKLAEHNITGFIDRLDMEGDDFEIHDYKTSNSLPEQKKLDQDRQLALYEIAVRDKWPTAKNVTLVWHFLQFDKAMRSTRTPEQLNQLKVDTVRVIDDIEAAKDFPAKETTLCSWCGYQDICPKHKHAHKVERLPVNEYLEDDGVTLVNRFIELSNKRAEADRELKKVKEAVEEYVKKEGVETIIGSDNKLSVNIENKPSFPSKSSDNEKYEKLKEILIEHGVWDQVAAANAMSLQSVVMGDEELKKALDELITWKESTRITKSKLKRD